MDIKTLEETVDYELTRIDGLPPSKANPVEWLRLHRFIERALVPYLEYLKKKAFGQMSLSNENGKKSNA